MALVLFMGEQRQHQVQQLGISLYTDITKMLSINMLWKLCILVAFGLSATVTSTDVAQDQPKKESLLSRFFGKKEEAATEPQDVPEPPKYSLEWYVVPKEENRKHLFDRLPECSQRCLPNDCNKPINPRYANRIREYFSLYTVDWYLLSEPESRAALRYVLPSNLAEKVPQDCNEPIEPEVGKCIREHFKVIEKKRRPNWFFRYY